MISVLLKRNYALLWVASLISGIGNFVLLAALPYFVYTASGSALASGGAFVSETLPMILFPVLGGVYADRWRRKQVLVGSDWLRGLLVLPLIAVHGPSTFWIVYLFGFLGAVVGNFAGPFGSAAIPHVVEGNELGSANAAFSVGGNVATLVGFPLGGILLQHLGLSAVVVLDSITFALSGLLSSLAGSLTAGALTDHYGSRLIMSAGGALWLAAGAIAVLTLAPALHASRAREAPV